MIRVLLLLSLILTSTQVTARWQVDDDSKPELARRNFGTNLVNEDFYKIDTITITEVTDAKTSGVTAPVTAAAASNAPKLGKSLTDAIAIGDKIIAFGTKIWKIVEAGEPGLAVSMAEPISVLPKLEGEGVSFYDMENWSAPKVRKYKIVFKNLYRMTVASFVFNVNFQSGGTYESAGQYLTGLSVAASAVRVSWGFDVDAESTLLSITNRGTKENPIAGATMNLKYTVSSPLTKIYKMETFHITGSGDFLKL